MALLHWPEANFGGRGDVRYVIDTDLMDYVNTIYGRLARCVAERPDCVAVIDVLPDGEVRRLTYAQFDQLIDTIGARFPVNRPRFVGIVADHGAEMIAAMMAVLKAGGAYVAAEPSFPRERVRYMMSEANVDFIIASPAYASRFCKRHPVMILSPGTAIAEDAIFEAADTKGDDPAYVLYTSGTTGRPKGVVVTNANVCHYARAFAAEFHPRCGDVMLQCSVCTFDIFVEEVFTTLLSGAALAIAPERDKASAGTLMDFVERHGVTEMSGFPYLLLDMNKLPSIPSSLRLIISEGDVLRAGYIDRLLTMTDADIYNTYGPSETTVCATYFRVNDRDPLDDGTYPIGHPVEGTQVEVLDEKLHPVDRGAPGEICIMGDGVSRGYLRDVPEQANFTTLPDGRQMYRSGDLGYRLPDGNFGFLHRKDTQVMIMGKRVECEEVENVLNAQDEVEAGLIRSDIDSSGLAYLTAYIVPKAGRMFSLKRLKSKLSRYLTPFMIPEFFVTLDHIPLTPNGKVDTHALPKIER